MDEEFWKTVRGRQQARHSFGRTGALNIALLFGTAAIALSLIITPMLAGRNHERQLGQIQDDFDLITTGAIKPAENSTKHYTIRRSVLQETPGKVCIVEGYGVDSDC